MRAFGILLVVNSMINVGLCANILAIYYHAGKSHHILGEALLKELARRGHNVTMVSPYPLSQPFPNYTDIHLTGIQEDQDARLDMFMKMNQGHALIGVNDVMELTRAQTELTLNHTEMRKLVKSGTKFDLVIIDWFFNDAILVYGKIFNAPVIPLASQGCTILSNAITGNPAPPSYVPNALLNLPNRMSFAERAANLLVVMIFHFIRESNEKYQMNLIRKYFEVPPTTEELKDNVALIFANSHYSFQSPRPFVPNVVPIGGFHIQKPKELPNDLQKLMDDAKDGVIYFSLGSNMRSTLLPEEKQQEILKAFSKIPQKVLWKWEHDDLPNLPENVHIRKWFPQNDILAHPNLKLFITHGGLLSTIESLHYGLPVIGIPIFGYQKSNIPVAVRAGYALQLEVADLSEKVLGDALHEILHNPKYAENAKKRSQLLHDQPLAPMDTAVFWVEHVIRHKGAPHLKNTGIYLAWYQYLMVDVVLVALIILTLVLCSGIYVTRKLCRLIVGKSGKTKTE